MGKKIPTQSTKKSMSTPTDTPNRTYLVPLPVSQTVNQSTRECLQTMTQITWSLTSSKKNWQQHWEQYSSQFCCFVYTARFLRISLTIFFLSLSFITIMIIIIFSPSYIQHDCPFIQFFYFLFVITIFNIKMLNALFVYNEKLEHECNVDN